MPRSARARSWGSTVKHQLIQDRQASPGTGHHEQPWRCRSDLLEIKATLRIAGRGPAMGPRAPGASRPTRTPPHPTRRTLCGVDPSMFRRQAVNPPSTALRTAGVGAWPATACPSPHLPAPRLLKPVRLALVPASQPVTIHAAGLPITAQTRLVALQEGPAGR